MSPTETARRSSPSATRNKSLTTLTHTGNRKPKDAMNVRGLPALRQRSPLPFVRGAVLLLSIKFRHAVALTPAPRDHLRDAVSNLVVAHLDVFLVRDGVDDQPDARALLGASVQILGILARLGERLFVRRSSRLVDRRDFAFERALLARHQRFGQLDRVAFHDQVKQALARSSVGFFAGMFLERFACLCA